MKVPLEILIKIFTLATQSRASAASWILYQRRTYSWFKKQLYQNVRLHDEDKASLFLHCLRRWCMHQEFSKTSIKAISLTGDVEGMTIMDILSLCTGITNLVVMPDESVCGNQAPLLQLLDALPLKVLSLQVCVELTHSSITNSTIFAGLTHFETDDPDMLQCVDIAFFPPLTHLALQGLKFNPARKMQRIVNRLFQSPTLKVLIFCIKHHQQFAKVLYKLDIHDSRIVLAPHKSYCWDDLGCACMLLWDLADETAQLLEPNHSQSILATVKWRDGLMSSHRTSLLLHNDCMGCEHANYLNHGWWFSGMDIDKVE
ncbi:hypothetical protein EV702DRAFT_1050670 [Suillus placidus]|uniref:Uncharacterized protein n=1 Tax=Suillus placidus TaxID=48579 RepID=A0A9P7CWE1_9AGAM|nr:hypothetical protein EV702DRAFT_1050670 [Suillus placidus]